MPTVIDRTEDIVARWRTDAGDDNPAGPLFTSGRYAEEEIVQPTTFHSHCSVCTASRTIHCC